MNPTLKDALKNEYVKSIIFLVVIVAAIFAFWFGLRAFLRTDYPLLAVASESMVPTLNRGDLIIVQGGLNPVEINVAPQTGDVIVFQKPFDPDELIVHRAIDKTEKDGTWYFRTQGDNNPGPDYWEVPETNIVGKVIWNIPYIGQVPLFVHTSTGMIIVVVLIVVIIIIEFIIPFLREERKPPQLGEPAVPNEQGTV